MNKLESAAIEVIDWHGLLSKQRKSLHPKNKRWHFLILGLVIFLHIGLMGYLFLWQVATKQKIPMQDEALVITFIDRVQKSEPISVVGKNKNLVRKQQRQFKPGDEITTDTRSAEHNEASVLRLSSDNNEWNIDPVINKHDPLKRKFIDLPGRAEPFVQGIKFNKQSSPKQKLQMLGKLFGAVEYDACNEARNRMSRRSTQAAALDVEADLRSIERHCRP